MFSEYGFATPAPTWVGRLGVAGQITVAVYEQHSFTLNDVTASVNPVTGYVETAPRVSRSGVFSGLALAALTLGVSAPTVGPFRWPSEVEAMVSVACWWVAMVLVVWLALSLAIWLLFLGRPGANVGNWVRLVTLPGSRKLAEGLLAVGVLAGVSACAPGANEIAAPRIEVLRPAEGTAVPTTLANTAELNEVDLGTLEFESAASATTLAGIGSLDDARVVVDTATLDSDPVEVPVDPGTDPFSPGGNALAPSLSPAVQTPQVQAPAPELVAAARHVIVDGDNFWSIACARVEAHLGREATDARS